MTFIERGGALYRVMRPILELLSYAWQCGLAADRLLTRRRRLPRPVISVGNLSFGGTGKTPFVIALGRRLAQRGLRIAILTRGYRTGSSGVDEPELISRGIAGARVLVSPDRYAAAMRSMEEPSPPDLFILDDGFQHWALDRDLDIVLLDAIVPFGLGGVFPAGSLREGVDALGRADLVLVTRANLVAREKLGLILEYLRVSFPRLVLATAGERVVCFRDLHGVPQAGPPEGPVFAACGIGNPASFYGRMEKEGLIRAGAIAFGDHHPWRQKDVAAVERAACRVGARAIVTTAKDATKIQASWTRLPWRVMEIETAFLSAESAFMDAVWDRLSRARAARCPQ